MPRLPKKIKLEMLVDTTRGETNIAKDEVTMNMRNREEEQDQVEELLEKTCSQDQQQEHTQKHKQIQTKTKTHESKPPNREIKRTKRHPSEFLPSYLRPFVQHSYKEFFISLSFDPRLVAQLMMEGFLPISNNHHLIPKLHKKRSVIYPLQRKIESKISESSSTTIPATTTPTATTYESCVHTSKSTIKKSNRYQFTVNQDFEGVVHGCHIQHGVSWLHPPIVQAFRVMNEQTKNEPGTGISANLIQQSQDDGDNDNNDNDNEYNTDEEEEEDDDDDDDDDNNDDNNDNDDDSSSKVKYTHMGFCPVRLYSIEVWNVKTGKLAAGELGYSAGSVYTSLTGFTAEDSAGSVQLATLGRYLSNGLFDMWDLGMGLEYKSRLGAKDMDRVQFVETIHKLRIKDPNVRLKCDERMGCKDIIICKSQAEKKHLNDV